MDDKDLQIAELKAEVLKYKELYLSWKFDYYDVYFGVHETFKEHWIKVHGEDKYWDISDELNNARDEAMHEHAEFLINKGSNK